MFELFQPRSDFVEEIFNIHVHVCYKSKLFYWFREEI